MDPKDLREFEPTVAQERVKLRFLKQVDARKGLVQVEALTLGELTALAGDRRVAKWLEDPAFVAWFTDRETFAEHANALKEVFIRKLDRLITGEIGDPRDGFVSEKAHLAAGIEILKITNTYPTKAKVVFADRDLNDMSEDEVATKIAEAKQRLQQERN